MDVTPTWWEWRQQQAEGLALDYDQMLAMVAESKEQEARFVALFRCPTCQLSDCGCSGDDF